MCWKSQRLKFVHCNRCQDYGHLVGTCKEADRTKLCGRFGTDLKMVKCKNLCRVYKDWDTNWKHQVPCIQLELERWRINLT